MILHLVKCEMCDNQFRFDPMLHQIPDHTPDTWFTVFQGKDLHAQEGWNFCSKQCLQAWLVQLAHAQGDDQFSRETEHIPYEYCCPKHYPLRRSNAE